MSTEEDCCLVSGHGWVIVIVDKEAYVFVKKFETARRGGGAAKRLVRPSMLLYASISSLT